MVDQEKIERLVREYCSVRDVFKKTGRKKDEAEALKKRAEIMPHLRCLVEIRASRYKRFDNHPDLEQDGFEALMLALHSFDPKKGSFTWWADKYISTRISRCANSHSTIHIPIARARTIKPHKTNVIPHMTDVATRPDEAAEVMEVENRVRGFVERLPEAELMKYLYGMTPSRRVTMKEAMIRFGKSRMEILRITAENEERLKNMIQQELV